MFVKNITETTQKIRIDGVETEIGAGEVFQTTESKAEELVRNYPSIIGYADAEDISGSGDLSDLDDVEITNPTDGQIMSFDETSEKWKNVELQQNLINIESESLYKNASLRMLGDDVIPLVIIAGQSNALGQAPYTSLTNRDSTRRIADNNYNVANYMMWNDTSKTFSTYNVRTNNGTGLENGDDGKGIDKYSFDPFFARYFINTYNKPLYAVKMTLGSIPIGGTAEKLGKNVTWNAKIGYFESQGGSNIMYLCEKVVEKMKNIYERAETNNKTIVPIAILWHQGESDWRPNALPHYTDNLRNVISFFRGIVGNPKIPFINAFIIKTFKPEYPEINNDFLKLNREDPFMKTVDMEGHYTDIGDGLHYDGQAFAYMGEKMFDYYKLYDYTPNEFSNAVDITSLFGENSIEGIWYGSGISNVTSLAEFENLTPVVGENPRSCVPNAIALNNYKSDYTKIKITALTNKRVAFIGNTTVDDTLVQQGASGWTTTSATCDFTNSTNIIVSIQIDDTAPKKISDYVKVELI